MAERFRFQAVRAVVGSLAVIVAGCGSDSGLSPVAPTPGFSAGVIEIAPAGAIVGTSVTLQSRLASDSSGTSLSYSWDFGDGSTGAGEAITHVYATAGDFFARLIVSSGEGSGVATLNIPVRSLTAQWSGDQGAVSITQDGLDLRGTYQGGSQQGIVAGRISEAGMVTFTVTTPGLAPVTFTGTAGPGVMTLEGAATGQGAVDRPWRLARN